MADSVELDQYSLSERQKTTRSISPHFIVDKRPQKTETVVRHKRRLMFSLSDIHTETTASQDRLKRDSLTTRLLDSQMRFNTNSQLKNITKFLPFTGEDINKSNEQGFLIDSLEPQQPRPCHDKVRERINRMLLVEKPQGSNLLRNANHLKARLSINRARFTIARANVLVTKINPEKKQDYSKVTEFSSNGPSKSLANCIDENGSIMKKVEDKLFNEEPGLVPLKTSIHVTPDKISIRREWSINNRNLGDSVKKTISKNCSQPHKASNPPKPILKAVLPSRPYSIGISPKKVRFAFLREAATSKSRI